MTQFSPRHFALVPRTRLGRAAYARQRAREDAETRERIATAERESNFWNSRAEVMRLDVEQTRRKDAEQTDIWADTQRRIENIVRINTRMTPETKITDPAEYLTKPIAEMEEAVKANVMRLAGGQLLDDDAYGRDDDASDDEDDDDDAAAAE